MAPLYIKLAGQDVPRARFDVRAGLWIEQHYMLSALACASCAVAGSSGA